MQGVAEGWRNAPSLVSSGLGRCPAIISMPGPCPCVNPGIDVVHACQPLAHSPCAFCALRCLTDNINRCPLCVCLPITSLVSAFQVQHVVCLPADHLQCTGQHASLLSSSVSSGRGPWPAIISMPGPCPCVNPGSEFVHGWQPLAPCPGALCALRWLARNIKQRPTLCWAPPHLTRLGLSRATRHLPASGAPPVHGSACKSPPAQHLHCTGVHASLPERPEAHCVRPLHASGVLCAGPVPVVQGALSTPPSRNQVPEPGPSPPAQ